VTASGNGALVVVEGLRKVFHQPGSLEHVRAVDGVSLALGRGEALGLVGESGSGKTTTARCIMRLTDPSAGRILFDDVDLGTLSGRRLQSFRSRMQYVFQNPYDSLNPRWRVRDTIEEPLILQRDLARTERRARVGQLLELVRLDREFLDRYPHELSGGQQQRVGIARALATEPELVVLDEPTSALDSFTRAEILELLNGIRAQLGTSYLFISHDLASVRRVCERIAVMYLGRIVEEAPAEKLFASPEHPYTRSLLSSVLEVRPDGRRTRARLGGEPPSQVDVPPGCRLHPRCPIAVGACAELDQELDDFEPGHRVACMRVVRREEFAWPEGWQ
jgi:oligopeptide/dipeptide ABC transporter ATP-binding protein